MENPFNNTPWAGGGIFDPRFFFEDEVGNAITVN